MIRLLMTGTDILEKHEIIICRQEELPLLLKIRNGEFMREDGTLSPEYYEILESYQQHFKEAAEKTTLPDEPDSAKVGEFVEYINRCAVMEDH
jgi:hypothetical protein